MKIRHLPATDLAMIAPLTSEQKRSSLERFKFHRPLFSYNHVKKCYPDLLNLEAGMFGKLDTVPLEKIGEAIRKSSCKSNDMEYLANYAIAEGLYNYVAEHGISGRKEDFFSMPTQIGQSLSYWESAILLIDEKPIVPYFNPRKKPLTKNAQRFVFSMMNERIKVENPDYKDITLGIFHFEPTKSGPRNAQLKTDADIDLYSFDELNQMIAETYDIWREVSESRAEEMQSKAVGYRGPLL